MPESPLVSVCILVLSDPGLALACLDSLAAAAATRAYGVETVVVANGAPDWAGSVLEERDDIVSVRSTTNLGFGGGNNLAAEVASGRFLLFLNDDSTVGARTIDHLLATAGTDATIGAVAGRILSADGSVQEAGSVLWDDGWAAHVGLGAPPGSTAFSYVRAVDYASANGLLVRREAWDAVGGFDDRYHPAYYEDVDLCLALHRHGYTVLYEPRAELSHLESQSSSYRYRYFLLIRNRARLVAKWSAELERFGPRPEVVDDAAIERAVHLARGAPPRLLWVLGGPDGVGTTVEWDAIESRAGAGWGVTVLVGPPGRAEGRNPGRAEGRPSFVPDRMSRADRLADLGVDVRDEDLPTLVALTGTDIGAVVVGAPSAVPAEPVVRPDGSPVPVLAFGSDPSAFILAVDATVEAGALRPRGRIRDSRYDPPMADTPDGRSGPPAEGPAGQALRELRAASLEIEAKDEYIADLQAEIADLKASLDEAVTFLNAKTAYIESRPSVRAKAWVDGLFGAAKR